MTTETIDKQTKELEKRAEKLGAMRSMLDFLEVNPTIPFPVLSGVNAFAYDADSLPDIARAMAPCSKEVAGPFYMLERQFGPLTFTVNFSRGDVCERVVVGSRFVEEKIIPSRTEDVVEWVCPDSILKAVASG